MRRVPICLAVASLSFTLTNQVALAGAVTTRIETRPYYGAVVTIEQGVRVWRALPPHDRIIIVPESAKNVKVHVHSGQHTSPPPATMNSNVNIQQSAAAVPSVGVLVPNGHPSRHYYRSHGTVGVPRH